MEEALRREPAMRLGWISWSDIWTVLRNAKESEAWSTVAKDLVKLLAYKNLHSFGGFTITPVTVPVYEGFWHGKAPVMTRWFENEPFVTPNFESIGLSVFWRG